MPKATAKSKPTDPARTLFEDRDPVAADIYSTLLTRLRAPLGKSGFVVDPKQTCVHLNATASGTAFAGLHPRRAAVLMTIRTDAPIKSARIRKSEQASRNRYHHDLLVASPEEVDAELVAWLKTAHRLAAASTHRIA